MKRDRATQLIEDLLGRVVAGGWPLDLVTELRLFGSYARGALEPHDVDIDVEYIADERWKDETLPLLLYGRDPTAPLRHALVGRSRRVALTFDLGALASDIDMLVLWRRGERLEQALDRLHAIAPDPTARRAERDSMMPAFEGLERWLARPVRELLVGLVEAGAITITQVELADGEVHDARAQTILHRRWRPDSPLRRAATAALAHLEARGVSLRAVHLQGRDIQPGDTPYYVGLQCRHIRSMPWCLAEWKGEEGLEVPRPTKTKALLALRITVADRDALRIKAQGR
jgi:hypothetical protein